MCCTHRAATQALCSSSTLTSLGDKSSPPEVPSAQVPPSTPPAAAQQRCLPLVLDGFSSHFPLGWFKHFIWWKHPAQRKLPAQQQRHFLVKANGILRNLEALTAIIKTSRITYTAVHVHLWDNLHFVTTEQQRGNATEIPASAAVGAWLTGPCSALPARAACLKQALTLPHWLVPHYHQPTAMGRCIRNCCLAIFLPGFSSL